MVTVAQYLSFIFSEITRARVLADTESLRIADEYAKSPLMKYFSVPRFKIPELELNIPMVVSGAQYANAFSFDLKEEDFEKPMHEHILRFGAQFEKPLPLDAPAMKPIMDMVAECYAQLRAFPLVQNLADVIKEKQEDMAACIDTLLKMLEQVYAGQKKAGSTATVGRVTGNNTIGTISGRINPAIINTRLIRIVPTANLPETWKATMNKLIAENIHLKESILKSLMISPETNVVKTEGTDLSILQIRAKITEEGIFVNSVKESDGTETKVVDFE